MMFIDAKSPNSQQVIFHDDTWTNKDLNTPVLEEKEGGFANDAIVIYPETIIANPLRAKRVVRYFGNREGYCNSRKVLAGQNDFILAHSHVIHQKPDYILFNADINPAFNDIGAIPFENRQMDVTYVGKGYIYGQVGIIPNTLFVGREWPQNQEQLAILLRQTRFFFTWDAWTSTNVEAVLCGAVPVVLSFDPWKSEEVDSSELGWLPRADLMQEEIALDREKFVDGRSSLITKINELSRSWNDRVAEFVTKVEEYF